MQFQNIILHNYIKKVLYEKLGIIIAHKFGNFVQNIDRIFVLEDGEICSAKEVILSFLSEGGIYKYFYTKFAVKCINVRW